MDFSGKHLEKHYKKIIIPDGSIKPNETVIIEVPPEFQSNRTFLTTRGNLNSTYSTTPQPLPTSKNVTRACNQTRTQNLPNANTNVFKTLDFSTRSNEPLLGKTYGSVNSSYGSQNTTGRFFRPQFTSTPKKSSPNASSQLLLPTTNYSLNATPQQTYNIEDYKTSDPLELPSPYLSTLYDSSSGQIDDSLMGKILRGEIGRVLVWPTPPSQRVNPTYNLDSGLATSHQTNSSTPKSLSKEYTNRVQLTNNKANLTYPQRNVFNTTTNCSKFSPPFASTTTRTKYGGFNYTGNLPPQYFPRNITKTVTPSSTSVGTYTCYSSDGPQIQTANSGNDTSNLESDCSNVFISQNQFKNANNLTCSSYGDVSKGKRVTFEKSTTTVQTYKEESETGEPPIIVQTTTKSETKTTGKNASGISMTDSESPELISNFCQTVNLNELSVIEERERNQLENDLRRMQEARRQLTMHAAKIGSGKLS